MEAALCELKRKLRSIWPHLTNALGASRRRNEAMSLGYGGVSLAHRASGLSRKAILKGMREIHAGEALVPGRIRLFHRAQGERRTDEASQTPVQQVSWRMELPHFLPGRDT